MKPKTSQIWKFFLEVDNSFAKCKTCEKNYSRKGRTTTSLRAHLKSMHKKKYEELCKIEEESEKGNLEQTTSARPLQQTKMQLSFEESFKKNQMWDTSHPKAKQMDGMIAEMIALQNLPLNFVEGIGFRRVMQTALPNYQLRGRQFFTDYICDEIYTKIATKIGQMLQNYLKLSFTTDIWSEPSANVSLLSLTAHGITENFTSHQIVLKCCPIDGQHTGEIICTNFQKMLCDWNIKDEQLHCFIRDGGTNMVKSLYFAKIADVSCTVHQIQLCVRSALETTEVKNLIIKCRKISGHFNHSQKAQDELTKIQTEQLNQPALRVIQDCVTRWNSTFHAIERLLKIKDSICLYASKHSIPQISPEEWLHLNKIVAILKPFEEMARNLSDRKSCISSVIPLIYILKHTLQIEIDKSDTNPNFHSIIEKLIDNINSRFCDISNNTLYSLATYLDPRYKLKFFDEINKQQVQSELLRLLTLHELNVANRFDDVSVASAAKKAKIEPMHDEPNTSCHILSPTKSVYSNLAQMLANSSDDEEIENDSTNNNLLIWKSLICQYNKEKRLKLDEDPLLWWKNNIKYKAFAPIVRTYLSPPSSSVPSEQLFSAAGLINEPLRNRLEGEKAAKLLFVKYNLPLLNFVY